MWQRWRYREEAKEKPTSVYVCVCVQQKRTVAISQTNEESFHQWLVCQISTKDLWSVVTLRGYKESVRPQEFILQASPPEPPTQL